MKQKIILKKDSLWQPGITPRETVRLFNELFSPGDLISLEFIQKRKTHLVKLLKNNLDISQKISSINMKNKNRKDLTFGAIRDKIAIALSIGMIKINKTDEKFLGNKSTWMNRDNENINFTFLKKINSGDLKKLFWMWKNEEKVHDSESINSWLNQLFITSVFSRKILYSPEEINKRSELNLKIGLPYLKHFFNGGGKNSKDFKKLLIYSSFGKEIDELIEGSIENFEIEFHKSKDLIEHMYQSMANLMKLVAGNNLEKEDSISFDYSPNSVDKKINNLRDGEMYVLEESAEGGLFSIYVNGIPIVDKRKYGTILWNIWGMILNGNIEINDKICSLPYNSELVRCFFKPRAFRNNKYNFVGYVAENNYRILKKNKGHFSKISNRYLWSGFKSWFNKLFGKKFLRIETMRNKLNYDRTKGSIKYLDFILAKQTKIIENQSFEKIKTISEVDKDVLKRRGIFKKRIDNHYKRMFEAMDEYTSLEDINFPIIERAHIFEVSESRDIGKFSYISDPYNGLLLTPNIHRLWDHGYLLLNSSGEFLTREFKKTKYRLKKSELYEKRKEYIEMRYLNDLAKIHKK